MSCPPFVEAVGGVDNLLGIGDNDSSSDGNRDTDAMDIDPPRQVPIAVSNIAY